MNDVSSARLSSSRSLGTNFFVGIFFLVACAAGAWLSVGLGDISLFESNSYDLHAEFDNISGLKQGASVEIAGVPVGYVQMLSLKDPMAKVTLRLDKSIQVHDDDIISIRTKGIIGDRYVKISRGSSSTVIPPNGVISETESVVDIEDLIGKLVHNMSNGSTNSDPAKKND
jgi:phospholipid/cholesterol/gamma-HCH transport system substrate-binding protein